MSLTSWRCCWEGIPILCKKGYADWMVTEGTERLFPSPSAHSTTVYYHAPPLQNITRLLMTVVMYLHDSDIMSLHCHKATCTASSSPSPYDLHLLSPLTKVLKGCRPQGHIGAVIPVTTHRAVSGGDPPVGVLVGCPSHCPWGMFLTAPTFFFNFVYPCIIV